MWMIRLGKVNLPFWYFVEFFSVALVEGVHDIDVLLDPVLELEFVPESEFPF